MWLGRAVTNEVIWPVIAAGYRAGPGVSGWSPRSRERRICLSLWRAEKGRHLARVYVSLCPPDTPAEPAFSWRAPGPGGLPGLDPQAQRPGL